MSALVVVKHIIMNVTSVTAELPMYHVKESHFRKVRKGYVVARSLGFEPQPVVFLFGNVRLLVTSNCPLI